MPDHRADLSDAVDPGLQSYTLDGTPFGLKQRIGEPDGAGFDVEDECVNPGRPVATGLETTHDTDGRLVQVKLLCGAGQ